MARGAASQPSSASLQFKEPISWKTGKPIAVPHLVKRLKALHSELRSLADEPEVDLPSVDQVAKDLAATGLLHHKDESIKAFLACCLADILYLYAPDAPYTANQLREIFDLFIKTLKGLEDSESTFYQEYLYLLDRLHETQSIVLITDLPGSDALITNLFTTLFDLSANEGEKNVEYKMTDLLEQVVEEVNTLPTEVIDVLLAQMMRASPTTAENAGKKRGLGDKKSKDQTTLLGARQYPPAYNMAKTICANCVDKMSRHICQYFTDVIMDASPASRRGESPDGDPGENLNDDLKEIEKAHNLMLELYLAVPEVLSNVLPLLETEMASETADLRVQATGTVGMMATTGSLPQSYPQTWKTWLGRANDKSVAVRVQWVEAAVEILKARTDVTQILQKEIKIKLFDADERVRVAAVKKIGELDWESATNKLVSRDFEENILETLAQRTKDKKLAVREAAIGVLSRLWADAYPQISLNNKVVIRELDFIPSSLLDVIYVNDKETNVILDNALYEYLLPIGDYSGKKDSKVKKSKGKESQAATQSASQSATQTGTQAESPEEELSEDEIRTRRMMVLLRCMTDSTEKFDGYNDFDTQEEANLQGKTTQEVASDRSRNPAQSAQRKEARTKLNNRARKAFFTIPKNQQTYAKAMTAFLESCEAFNGGVMETDEADIRRKLDNTIAYLAKLLPDTLRSTTDLVNFAKIHDRRCYDQIRRCYSPDSDYETVANSIFEAKKRISNNTKLGSLATASLVETMTPLLYRVSLLIYNKSHIAHMIRFSTDEDTSFGTSLNLVAHEVLREMSQSNPGVFGAHIKTLCDLIVDKAPIAPRSKGRASAREGMEIDLEGLNMEDTIKACSGFAKQYPKELPHDKKLMEALVNFSLYGTSSVAAKHAVAIIMRTSSRGDMYASDLIKKILKEWEYGSEFYLARLATLSQVVLFACREAESDPDNINRIRDIAIKEVLLRPPEGDVAVTEDDDEDDDLDRQPVPSEACQAKLLALKILINHLRAHGSDEGADGDSTRKVLAEPVYKLLNALLANNGELSKKGDTPKDDRQTLYWAGANAFIKLARIRGYEILISPSVFNRIALVAEYNSQVVRKRFVDKVKKHLAASTLSARYYTSLFLLADEKQRDIKEEASSWLKARAKSHREAKDTSMETTFARLLSLLAHHPDFDRDDEDVLKQFAGYVLFYLECVVVEENLSLVYYVAQRMKSVVDGIVPDRSESLYTLSDLAQVVIRKYEDVKGWALQTWPGTLRLPMGLFKGFKDNATSNEVARKHYLPDGFESVVDSIFKKPSNRKRKSDAFGAATPAKKRSRTTTTTPGTAKKTKGSSRPSTIKKKKKRGNDDEDEFATPGRSVERRKSGRITSFVAGKYAESEDEEEDEEDEVESGDEKMEWEKSARGAAIEEEEEDSEQEHPKRSNGVSKPKVQTTPQSAIRLATKSKSRADLEMADSEQEEEAEASEEEDNEEEENDVEEEEEEDEDEENEPSPPPVKRGGRKQAIVPAKKAPPKKENIAKKAASPPSGTRGTRASARTRGKANGKAVISQMYIDDDDDDE
ncbi:hypothetical protein TWF106_010526 [Orbilia oligospora]|uniref:Sister chromatid cohesion protein PDS5 n=1 Tax=Orbilia oligospora TaxID=2813651 RepID=A0A7C8USQ3_ORBOL|nr:hypothetical protein TWF788_001531 [Orbilia oligospora]KAF3214174.1 hypothetical protein TWF679_005040 [Orbilia oligospora]KAF3223419.1 hypothetical protein TWF191_006430 [Orbilia oligospora]KAF3227038.1 hypothetical protein TWF106_010526 [Orbilia oligospora]